MKTVLVLNQFALPQGGAGGTRHVELFGRLENWSSTFIAGSRSNASQEELISTDPNFILAKVPFNNRSVVSRLFGWFVYCVRAHAIAKKLPVPDVVYASSPHLLTPVIGWIIARRSRAKLVVEVRDLWPDSFVALGAIKDGGLVHKGLHLIEKWIYRRADSIVGVTEEWRSYFKHNAPRKPYTPIPNGTDLDLFSTSHARPELIPSCATPDGDGLLFIFTGSHGPKDGLDFLLDVVDQFPDDRFVLIGDGTDKPRLRTRTVNEGLDNVVLLDSVPKTVLPHYLKSADVGLHLVSDWKIFKRGMSPNKLHDYMGAEVPVISNAEGEPHKILAESGGGVGVRPAGLADGIRAMKAMDTNTRRSMGFRGFEWMSKNRSRSIVMKRLDSVLNSVVQTEPPVGDCTRSHSGHLPSVVHISSAHPWSDNRIHYREAASLASAGYKVQVVAVDLANDSQPARGVGVERIKRRGRCSRLLVGTIQAVARAFKTDAAIIHLHDPELIPAIPLFRIAGKKVVYDAHEDLPDQVRSKYYIPPVCLESAVRFARVLVKLSTLANHVVAATEKIAERYPKTKVSVVRNYPILRKEEESAKALDARGLNVVYVGALSDSRGGSQMVEAAASFPPGWSLTIAGTSVPGHYREALSQKCGWETVADHGVVSPVAARDLMLNARIGLVTLQKTAAYTHSLPTKMFEYMSAGLAIVVSDFPLWAEIVERYDCGVVVDEKSPGAIASAISQYANDPELLIRHGNNGRAAALNHFNWQTQADILIGAYRRVCS